MHGLVEPFRHLICADDTYHDARGSLYHTSRLVRPCARTLPQLCAVGALDKAPVPCYPTGTRITSADSWLQYSLRQVFPAPLPKFFTGIRCEVLAVDPVGEVMC